MTKGKSTKSALFSSAVALFLCFTMLLGTTFAWFTDTVTSSGNIIQTGKLKVAMSWAKGNENPDSASWQDASSDAIFNSKVWEPGYTEVRHIKIENKGTLALKYNVAIQANGVVGELADVIDVYYMDPAVQIDDRTDLPEDKLLGNLTSVLAALNTTGAGALDVGESDTITIALKMRESAGNAYQELSIGSDFSVVLFATQYTAESDSIDDQYDADAPNMFTVNGVAYDTANEALAVVKDGDNVYLSGLNTPITINNKINLTIANTNIFASGVTTLAADAQEAHAITVNADATITVDGNNVVTGGKGADGIHVAEGVTLTLTGNGNLVAKGNGGSETQAEYNAGKGGSGIDVEGNIVITDLKNLTAEGYGKHAFGIGGATMSIVIKNSTVNYAKGGMVDTKIGVNYGKGDIEAGAAIGSYTDGAVIEITNSVVHNAQGGSKSAGIGAMYHTGVTVKITDSTVTAFGGSSSAGIGGSRVEYKNDAITPEQTAANAVTVKIVNSKVEAVGGDFGAGIGSGYDTYCKQMGKAPLNRVEIDAKSDITAQGGWLAAGIGTGHNVINFEGVIECDTSKVKAGSSDDPTSDPFNCCWGMPTTIAENVGLGVYNIKNCLGKEVTKVSTADELVAAFDNLSAGAIIYLANDIDMTGKSIAPVTGNMGFTMLGNGHTISNLKSDKASLFVAHSGSSSYTFDSVNLENCSVDSTTDYGALFVGDGDTSDAITITNCHVKNCTVKSAKWAAAFIGYTAGWNVQNDGPVYSDVTITDCSVTGGSITGGGSTAAAIAHAGANPDTTNIITNFKVDGVAINGEDAEHTGIVVGTANIGKTIINNATYSNVTGNYNTVTILYGRTVLGTTGSLTIDGEDCK